MTGNLREFRPLSERSRRDPSGKRAIFSTPSEELAEDPPSARDPAPRSDLPEQPDQQVPHDAARPGTLVVECSTCEERTRVTYFDFALLNLPLGFFVPVPGRRYKHHMTCPACHRWTWLEAHWLA